MQDILAGYLIGIIIGFFLYWGINILCGLIMFYLLLTPQERNIAIESGEFIWFIIFGVFLVIWSVIMVIKTKVVNTKWKPVG